MKIIKTYYLIDYENVGSEGFKGCGKLRETDIIHLFYTDNSRKIDLDIINDHGESKLINLRILLLVDDVIHRTLEVASFYDFRHHIPILVISS